ncbi:hypothetical protein [Catenuloplanes indicus]|uniref:Uncharacterized protein n=1 Tax=Catenuloplanes indicus TaxID=137267 RepID=A0AAE3W075_9ACTN|nr:hypothetical protein [Catenuloplanes indicus]MDQ0366837.1 hypothetical protein [Catenuloplanes indicus]
MLSISLIHFDATQLQPVDPEPASRLTNAPRHGHNLQPPYASAAAARTPLDNSTPQINPSLIQKCLVGYVPQIKFEYLILDT